ncbi:hypothetical protein [Methylobacterium sp. 22177]|uniref:hypothetical protein n=1 Tax=Methylobacterium sp. 22177 TaxID=3453885 RepID=UPI003F8287D9
MDEEDRGLDRLALMEDVTVLDEEPGALGASPPFALICDPRTEADMYIGQFPLDPDIGQALVFARSVEGGDDGYEKGQLYVLMRFAADPSGRPVRFPVPRTIDERITLAVQILLEKNAAEWGFEAP